tara:strand:+ start:148 stop:447 length:300 start_codon:yes stop_codon:yes gene_type:complete
VEIKNKKSFNKLIKSLTLEIAKEDLDEMTSTANVDGYSTPFAFSGKGKNKSKEISTNSTNYELVKEALDDKDFKVITKLIRNVVGDILRDIWLKRTAWK